MKFHHIAFTGHTEYRRMDTHGTNNQQVAAAFRAAAVRFFVQNRAVHRAVILRPLVLHMDERHCRRQNAKCCKPESWRKSSSA